MGGVAYHDMERGGSGLLLKVINLDSGKNALVRGGEGQEAASQTTESIERKEWSLSHWLAKPKDSA